jgi:cytoskeletal protein CcmA (bactofilin family)
MSALPKRTQSPSSIIPNESILENTSDLAIVFDRWLEDLKTAPKQVAPDVSELIEEIYFEAARGSKGEVSFDGILHFDGHTLGNIRSPQGTLILTKESRVEADIDVRAAIISGSVTGNISAAEYVVLDNDARVAGQIHTRLLSVRLGALFEGDCLFVTTSANIRGEDLKDKEKPRQRAMASVAGA